MQVAIEPYAVPCEPILYTVSLDSLDPTTFKAPYDLDFCCSVLRSFFTNYLSTNPQKI